MWLAPRAFLPIVIFLNIGFADGGGVVRRDSFMRALIARADIDLAQCIRWFLIGSARLVFAIAMLIAVVRTEALPNIALTLARIGHTLIAKTQDNGEGVQRGED